MLGLAVEQRIQSLSIEAFTVAILEAISAAAVFAVMGWIAIRRPAVAVLFVFFLFAFGWRVASMLYIDLAAPVFSEQLERNIGSAMGVIPLAISQVIVLAAVLFAFRPRRMQALYVMPSAPPAAVLHAASRQIAEFAFWAVLLFVIGLFIELLIQGPIPLFAEMERFDYAARYAGPLHQRLLEWGPMLAFQLGVFFIVPTLHDRPVDRRFSVLFAILMVYLFLVGHRFSSFYAYVSFFLIGVGAGLLGLQAKGKALRDLFNAGTLRIIAIAAAALVLLVGTALVYSYTVVRGFEGAELAAKLKQRILIQQGEMWWATFHNVFRLGDWDGGQAFYKLFVDPFDPTRNSTMQFLMERALPDERAHFILAQGSSYTGGWPEVCFELGGPFGGFLLVVISAIVFAEFMFLLARCIIQERLATCFFLSPILYALSINIVSGMANSFIQTTFVVKLAVALIVYITEDKWRSSRMLVPSSALPGTVLLPEKKAEA